MQEFKPLSRCKLVHADVMFKKATWGELVGDILVLYQKN